MGRIALAVVGLAALLAMAACDLSPTESVAQPTQPLAQPARLNSAQQQAVGETAVQEVVEAAENELIIARFKEAIDAMPRDAHFEQEGRNHAEEFFPGSRVGSIRCSETACYLTIVASSPLELLEIRPEELNWGRFAHVVPDHSKFLVFAVLSRGEHSLPAIDLAP